MHGLALGLDWGLVEDRMSKYKSFWDKLGRPDHGDPTYHVIFGLHSNIPRCCTTFFITATQEDIDKQKGSTSCPECFKANKHISLHMCWYGCGNGYRNDPYPPSVLAPFAEDEVRDKLKACKIEVDRFWQYDDNKCNIEVKAYTDFLKILDCLPGSFVHQDVYERIEPLMDISKVV